MSAFHCVGFCPAFALGPRMQKTGQAILSKAQMVSSLGDA